jgi:putative ABC transport system substrate-binding protein
MQRREFITLIGGVLVAWPIGVRAQQPVGTRRIGFLSGGAPQGDPLAQEALSAFLEALRQSGWTEGRNLRIEYRWPSDDAERMRADAASLAGLNLDLIVAASAPAVAAMARATSTTPIVQVGGADPVELGFAPSLANPNRNITGFANFEPTVSGKWLDVLTEIAPAITRALVLQDAENPNRKLYFPSLEAVARERHVELSTPELRGGAEIGPVIDEFASKPSGGLVVLPGPFNTSRRPAIIAQAARHGLPAVYPFPVFVKEGGLISYGIDPVDIYRRSASYVNRILRGGKPADLPFQLPTKFQLTINLKTAKALGLAVPASLLAAADEVVE